MKTINKESFEYVTGRCYAHSLSGNTEKDPMKVLRKIFKHLPTNENWLAGFCDAWLDKQK